jgi:hypothetical protein
MNPLRAFLTSRPALPGAQRQLLWCAGVVAVSLLSFYVHLLHESVALGEQMRAQQRASSQVRPLKPAAPPTRLAEQRSNR